MSGIDLIGAEDVRRAGQTISAAADQMQRAASGMDTSAERLIRSLDDHAMRVCDSLESAQAERTVTRDEIAIRAMQGLLARPFTKDERGRPFIEWVSSVSYEMADAMLEARK